MSYLILFLSVAVGAGLMLIWQPSDRRTIKLLTAFGGAYILAVTSMHLLPEVFGPGPTTGTAVEGTNHAIGLWLLAGFFVQLILDYFSHGIEHGHAHHHSHDGRVPWGIVIGLCIHAYLEGTPLAHIMTNGSEHGLPPDVHNALLTGIVMHNVPVSIVLMSMLQHNGLSRMKSVSVMTLFALMSPLGMLTARLADVIADYERQLMAIVIGIFLHIATTILFETGEEHRFNLHKLLAIVAGAGLAIGVTFLHQH